MPAKAARNSSTPIRLEIFSAFHQVIEDCLIHFLYRSSDRLPEGAVAILPFTWKNFDCSFLQWLTILSSREFVSEAFC